MKFYKKYQTRFNMADLIVTVKEGMLRGKKYHNNVKNMDYYRFCGIPYAEPPVGNLRFRPPEPCKSWKGIRDCTVEADICLQYALIKGEITGSEDCLYLNVNTTTVPSECKELKAVLVLVHPGGNVWGSGNSDDFGNPDYILNDNIIYVTFNFRLSVFGFLNFMIPECSGNAGLKDMLQAFKWIKQNIKAFGGDPSNITVFGCSAGAATAHLVMCSPKAKGLINKAILDGCHGACPKCFQLEPLELAKKYAAAAGFHGRNARQAVLYLKKKSAYELHAYTGYLKIKYEERLRGVTEITFFHPSIEIMYEDAFLIHEPHRHIKSMEPAPLMLNLCNKEGMFIFTGNPFQYLNNNFSEIVQRNMCFWKMSDSTLAEVSKEIRKFYFGNSSHIDDSHIEDVINLYTDFWTAEMHHKVILPLQKQGSDIPVYVSQFTYDSPSNYMKHHSCVYLYKNGIKVDGACHADWLEYWSNVSQGTLSGKDLEISNRICQYITNFAKSSNPNNADDEVYWLPTTIEEPCYLEFGSNLKMINGRLNDERVKFWEGIYRYINDKLEDNPNEKENV